MTHPHRDAPTPATTPATTSPATPSSDPPSARTSPDDAARLVAWGQELRSVHSRLRDALEVAREAVADHATSVPGAVDPRRELGLFCHGFCQALEGHHRGEDASVFTALLELRPDLADVVAELKRDHSMLDHLLGNLARAVDDHADAATLERHLDGIDAVMETHFRYEEKRLVEVLDEPAVTAALAGTDRREVLGPLA